MNTSKYFQVSNLYPHLKNPQKMIAENKLVTVRSSWECAFILKFLDIRDDIISWTSEDFYIPYFYEVDKQYHRYFPDFLMKSRLKDGSIKETLIEIKPLAETRIPVKPKKVSKVYIDRVHTYIKNSNKWDAANKWCQEQTMLGRPITFQILTELDLKGIIKC